MVYKVCKGGVRSGNTLRSLHSLRTRRYASQACVVGRSNLSGKQIESLLEESTDDSEIKNALMNTDVVLSLNKKRRWRLPATVNHMIKSGNFSDSKAMVSVLERHKLKRRANCVGFTCSKQTGGSGLGYQSENQSTVNEGQKGYFSYSLDHVDQEESRRQRKKRIAKEIRALAKEKKHDKKLGRKKIVDVFTMEGRKNNMYNLEVFYPCPQTCSLTYNPKYTDVTMTQDDDGEMEIRSNIRNGNKSRKKHRKRFTASDLRHFNIETSSWNEDVHEMWREVYDDMQGANDSNQVWTATEKTREDSISISPSPEANFSANEDQTHSSYISESILASLIDQAELAKEQWSHAYTLNRRRRKSSRDELNEERKRSVFQRDDTPSKPHIFKTVQSKSLDNVNKSQALLTKVPVLISLPVVLSTTEVSPKNLTEKFGKVYTEADCQPRRFCINVTEGVRNIMGVPGRYISSMYTTFIIFTSADVHEDGLETYRVTANCAGCPESEHITYSMPYGQTTLQNVINTVVGNLFDLKRAGHLNFCDEISSRKLQATAPINEMMMLDKFKIHVDTFFTSDELSRASELGELQEKTMKTKDNSLNFMNSAAESEFDIFCEICYDNINTTRIDALQGTKLNACGHLFCDSCWRTHLRTRSREGSVHLKCPGYQCDTKLGPTTLLSLLHVTEVAQILQRACEDEVETCPTAKWCPNPSCGRVIKLSTKSPHDAPCQEQSFLTDGMCLDVTCACGGSWCFNCLYPAHWPARCQQVPIYLEKVKTLKPRHDTPDDDYDDDDDDAPDEVDTSLSSVDNQPVEVEGRLCPRCRRFIEKNGGCPHMTCKCGLDFCWICLKEYNYSHSSSCTPSSKIMDAYTRIVRIRHLAHPVLKEEDDEPATHRKGEPHSTKTLRNRQKATMYHRAMQQRAEARQDKEKYTDIDELVVRISRAARKDLQFKEEVLLQCGFPKSGIPDFRSGVETLKDAMNILSVIDSVKRYLTSCQRARQALRHVAEYTFVLLQDCPASTDKRRAFRVASDLIAYCSFSSSVLRAGGNQDPHTALKRLSDIQVWSSRALDALLSTVHRLKH